MLCDERQSSAEIKLDALRAALNNELFKEKAYEILFNQFLKDHDIIVSHKKNRSDCYMVWRAMIKDTEEMAIIINDTKAQLVELNYLNAEMKKGLEVG